MHRVHHERSNIAVSFAEHLIFQKKYFQTFTHALRVGKNKPRLKLQYQDTLHCENAIQKVFHKSSNITASSRSSKSSRKKKLYTRTLGEYQQIKIKNWNKDTMQLESAKNRVIHKRKNITFLSRSTDNFQKSINFTHTVWVNSGKSK